MFIRPTKLNLRLLLGLTTATLAPSLVSAASAPAPFTSVLPAAAKQTGGAVLIVPGGAAAGDTTALARWLSERGIAAFVLRASAASGDKAAAVSETAHAMQYLRAHAADFKVSPHRIALLGFAAGADIAADVAYTQIVEAKPDAADPVEKVSSRPDLVALIWGATPGAPAAGGPKAPPTFLVGSTSAGDNLAGTIDLWNKLRAARSSVDAHFFAKADLKSVLASDNLSVGSWPESFFAWARFCGLLTDEKRLPVKGMVYLDGHTLPHGYVIFTPIGFVGSGPIIGRVLNSTSGKALGLFEIPADQGPSAGRYKVEVYQLMNRWLSNSFSNDLVGGRGGGVTPEKAYFGHHRLLAPTIDDVHVYGKMRPTDKGDYVVEFKPDAEANNNLKIEIFTK